VLGFQLEGSFLFNLSFLPKKNKKIGTNVIVLSLDAYVTFFFCGGRNWNPNLTYIMYSQYSLRWVHE